MAETWLDLPVLLPKQEQIAAEALRFNVLECGRRFGKTAFGEDRLISHAIEKSQPVAWFAPVYKQLAEVWRDLQVMAKPVIARMAERGLLGVIAGTNVVRFLPALNTTRAEVDEAVMKFKEAL